MKKNSLFFLISTFILYPLLSLNAVKVTNTDQFTLTEGETAIVKELNKEKIIANTKTTLDISTLPDGFYYIKVDNSLLLAAINAENLPGKALTYNPQTRELNWFAQDSRPNSPNQIFLDIFEENKKHFSGWTGSTKYIIPDNVDIKKVSIAMSGLSPVIFQIDQFLEYSVNDLETNTLIGKFSSYPSFKYETLPNGHYTIKNWEKTIAVAIDDKNLPAHAITFDPITRELNWFAQDLSPNSPKQVFLEVFEENKKHFSGWTGNTKYIIPDNVDIKKVSLAMSGLSPVILDVSKFYTYTVKDDFTQDVLGTVPFNYKKGIDWSVLENGTYLLPSDTGIIAVLVNHELLPKDAFTYNLNTREFNWFAPELELAKAKPVMTYFYDTQNNLIASNWMYGQRSILNPMWDLTKIAIAQSGSSPATLDLSVLHPEAIAAGNENVIYKHSEIVIHKEEEKENPFAEFLRKNKLKSNREPRTTKKEDPKTTIFDIFVESAKSRRIGVEGTSKAKTGKDCSEDSEEDDEEGDIISFKKNKETITPIKIEVDTKKESEIHLNNILRLLETQLEFLKKETEQPLIEIRQTLEKLFVKNTNDYIAQFKKALEQHTDMSKILKGHAAHENTLHINKLKEIDNMVQDIESALALHLAKDSEKYLNDLHKIANDNTGYAKQYLKPLTENYRRATLIMKSITQYKELVKDETLEKKRAEKKRLEKEQREKKEKERAEKIKEKVTKGKWGKVEGGLENLAKAREAIMKKKSQEEEERKKKLEEEELKKKIEEDERIRKAEEEKRIKEESEKQRDEMIRRIQEEEERRKKEAGDDFDQDWSDDDDF